MTIALTRGHVRALFDDARLMHVQARERLAQGGVRDAAEKAWFVTKRAADALVLSRTDQEPPSTRDTTEELRALARQSNVYETLVGHYFTRTSYLHGTCFFN